MLFVSPEQGSADLVEPLRKQGIDVDMVKLDWADVEFTGRGVGGEPVSVGVEVKRLSELTTDWDRFAGEQIPKMVANYEYRYLVYEGEWLQDRQGRLVQRGKGWSKPYHGQNSAVALDKKLMGLPLRAGVLVERTRDRTATVRKLVNLYRMWTDDDFDKHTSHLVVYQPHSLLQNSDTCKALAAWPNMGLQRAKAAEKLFGSVKEAANASITAWSELETVDGQGRVRRLGEKTAAHVHEFLEGR